MKNFILIALVFVLIPQSFASAESLVDKHKGISQTYTFFENEDLESLEKTSKSLISYCDDFHPQIIQTLTDADVMHGKQLTTFHEIASYYIGIHNKLDNIASTSSEKSKRVSAKLLQWNNFYQIYFPYYRNDEFRRYINDADLSFGLTRFQVHKTIESLFVKEDIQEILGSTGRGAEYQSLISFLNDEVAVQSLFDQYEAFHRSDVKADQRQDLEYRVSRDFGNTIGRVRWRKGYLWNNQKITSEILEKLKPLDIITEKTYFALTDKFIPGHFGHNAIWLGTKEQLKEINMWEHPAIRPYQKQIEDGMSLIEVDRSGSHLKSLPDFMNVDELAIMRMNRLSFHSLSIERTYNILLAQMGKIYDFNFDVETTDTLVCSELIYQSFEEIRWPTEAYLGRTTISPDNVASLALYDDAPLDLVYYAAQKSKNDFKYKNLEDLAKDMGFKKVGDRYKRPEKTCRGRGRSRRCEDILVDLKYTDHDPIPSLNLP